MESLYLVVETYQLMVIYTNEIASVESWCMSLISFHMYHINEEFLYGVPLFHNINLRTFHEQTLYIFVLFSQVK